MDRPKIENSVIYSLSSYSNLCNLFFSTEHKSRCLYGSPFLPRNKNKKGNCDFLSHNSVTL